MNAPPGKAIEMQIRRFRIDRKRISFLRFIIEAYEGLAVVSTLSAKEGLVILRIAPNCEDYVNHILNDLRNRMIIQEQLK